MDITHVLHKIRPNTSWTVGDDYESLVWMDESSKPTKQEVEAAWDEVEFNIAAERVRYRRNELLAETDWMALSDVEISQSWKDYRQALRDITKQEEFPLNCMWPEKPDS